MLEPLGTLKIEVDLACVFCDPVGRAHRRSGPGSALGQSASRGSRPAPAVMTVRVDVEEGYEAHRWLNLTQVVGRGGLSSDGSATTMTTTSRCCDGTATLGPDQLSPGEWKANSVPPWRAPTVGVEPRRPSL